MTDENDSIIEDTFKILLQFGGVAPIHYSYYVEGLMKLWSLADDKSRNGSLKQACIEAIKRYDLVAIAEKIKDSNPEARDASLWKGSP